MTTTTALIITTYNRPDALAAVLRAVAAQTLMPQEIIIADDGSVQSTRDVIQQWRAPFADRLIHVWQEDRGFRAAEARNRAIMAATGDLIVFLDGDCLPRRDFLARHVALAEAGAFTAGNRILLSQAFTAAVLASAIPVETWPLARLMSSRLRGDINRLAPLLALPDGAWRLHRAAQWQGVRTCNLAVWRQDVLRVDGFDCDFQGWGLEDSDLAIRLMNAGLRHKDGRFATGVFHLWHREEDRTALADNRLRLDEVMTERRIRAGRGLSTLQPVNSASLS